MTAPFQRITCGNYHPDPSTELRYRMLANPTGGCGRPLPWTQAYRCVDCTRWFHQLCIKAHFQESAEAPY